MLYTYKNKQYSLCPCQADVLDFMIRHGTISTLTANYGLHETRLAARIFELKEKGIKIESYRQDIMKANGRKTNVSFYYLKGVENEKSVYLC